MPELVELHEERASKEVRVVAVCLDAEDRSPQELRDFLEEHEIRLPVQAVQGSWDPIAEHYGFMGPPFTVLIGREGEQHVGLTGVKVDPADIERLTSR